MPSFPSSPRVPSGAVEVSFHAFAGNDVYSFKAYVDHERPTGLGIYDLRLLWRGCEIAVNLFRLKPEKQEAISDSAFEAWRRATALF